MELRSEENGETISISSNGITSAILGRSNASLTDLTVSRQHLSLNLINESTICFDVIGKNPIVVVMNGCKRICRNGDKGELKEGDRLSLVLQNPSFWVVKPQLDQSILEAVKRREKRTMERRREREELREEKRVNEGFDLESETSSLDLSCIDPVQEYGFIRMGHEFDKYPKNKIQPIKNLNWYLDEPNKESSSDDSDHETDEFKPDNKSKKKRGKERDEDEDWIVKVEQEKDFIAKDVNEFRNKRSKYDTRSKDVLKEKEEDVNGVMNRDIEYEDDDDETLGGFIVTDDEVVEEPCNTDDEEEEEQEEEFEDEE